MRAPAVLILVLGLCAVGARTLPAAEDEELERAISLLRGIPNPGTLSAEEKKTKVEGIMAAWKILGERGEAGTDRVKRELDSIREGGEKDDYFKLCAAAFLWELGKLEEAELIGRLYEEADVTLHYQYVFLPTFFAARTGDERALPMLKASLRDKKGEYEVARHAMTLRWPLTHDFLWGVYGPAGLPILAELLETSLDPVVLEAAAYQLGRAQYLPARPALRKLAESEEAAVRRGAVRVLGALGHPDDFELLLGELDSEDPEDLWSAAYALFEFGDLRAAARLAPLAGTEDAKLRSEVIATLAHLLWPESFEAIREFGESGPECKQKEFCAGLARDVLEKGGCTWEEYRKKDREEQEGLFLGILKEADDRTFALREGDRELTHEMLLEAAEEWIERGRIRGGRYSWVEDRHVISAATPDDLELLLRVRAVVYRRLSDECLYEVRILDRLIARLGRGRYRAHPGTCPEVKPK